MSVYVDSMRKAGSPKYDRMCCMIADTPNELEAMAVKLELKKSWKHNDLDGLDYYNLTAGKRTKAIMLGAISITTQQMAAKRQEAVS